MLDYQSWASQLQRLDGALRGLVPQAEAVGVPSPARQEWYELLQHKLLPQVSAAPLLVVAVVGGTNIGKSVIFNHLANETASAVSPLAAGTKHPVCIVHANCQDAARLQLLFQGFQLQAWQSAEDPLRDAGEHLLFWRVGPNVPDRLLLLDTPDIDSDAQINWQRADMIRQCADVLVAVLTQQKYNDAAVKQFFRKAVEADKPVVLVFNQCDPVEDREFWPQWLHTFCHETGARPELVYVVPYDRAAARSMALPFFEVGQEGTGALDQPRSLRQDLAALQFDAIKIRTFRGALTKVLDRQQGAPQYLERLRHASREFAVAAGVLGGHEMARVQWPNLPTVLLVDEIRQWWDENRSAWSRKVHGIYRQVGQTMLRPILWAWRAVDGKAPDPLPLFRSRERDSILEAVQKLLDELERLSQVGNDTLRPRLARLLGGASRERLLSSVTQAHAALAPVDDDFRKFLRGELDGWLKDNPRAHSILRFLDHTAALARPAITVSLAISGWVVAGDVVGHAATHVVTQTATNLATEAAIAGGITGGGEVMMTATGEGVKHAAAILFLRLQQTYAERRAQWLAEWLERELLQGLLTDLRQGAELAESAAAREMSAALGALASGMRA